MSKYLGIKTRRITQKQNQKYAIERLGTAGWVGLTLVVFLLGAICGICNARFGGF